jgi:putative sugar O-methyltransferase
MSDALYRLDYWRKQTNDRYSLIDLSSPTVGNPYGVFFDGVLVRTSSDYQHYCSHKIALLLEKRPGAVMEIGGGFGGTAYYLLRDCPGITYLDFDVPESIALTTYYLIKCFPERKVLLYGEGEMTAASLKSYDIVLMPLYLLPQVPGKSIEIAFSSHAMSDISSAAMKEYLDQISRTTSGHFWYIGNDTTAQVLQNLIGEPKGTFSLLERESSLWENYRESRADIVELLYEVK